MPPELSPELKDLLTKITGRWTLAYDGTHKRARERWTHFHALYHNFTAWKDTLPGGVDRRDRDLGLRAAKREWGAELFIPYSFATVETILARMLSNNPSMLVLPRNRASESNTDNVKYMLEAQQQQMDYPITLQQVCRDALIGGLGVQKVIWKRQSRTVPTLQPRQLRQEGQSEYVTVPQDRTIIDDPWIMRVDPFDFVWDPFGFDVRSCEWIIHRTWRSTEYCKRLLTPDPTGKAIWTGLAPEDLDKGPGGQTQYTEAWRQRMSITGYKNYKAGGDIHEVWEYHDGDNIVTVLDRQWIVQQAKNPAWHGDMPFQIYRPTHVGGQFAGKGEIEPIEDLQQEINTLRSQRRDNATLVLQKAFFYADGMIDPEDFKFGPGKAIPTLGDPREAIFPVQIGDIPNSSVTEERALQDDIARATGIDDQQAGAGQSVEQTATGAQLVQAAANLRIQLKARTCEIELVRSGAIQMLALDQQKILTNREVRIPAQPTPEQPDRRWGWLEVGPMELAGEFDLDVEGGSMAPENVPQQRADANMWLQIGSNPQIGQMLDPAEVARRVLKNLGERAPEALLRQQPMIPAQSLQMVQQMLQSAGVSPELVGQAIAAASNGGNPSK